MEVYRIFCDYEILHWKKTTSLIIKKGIAQLSQNRPLQNLLDI